MSKGSAGRGWLASSQCVGSGRSQEIVAFGLCVCCAKVSRNLLDLTFACHKKCTSRKAKKENKTEATAKATAGQKIEAKM